MKVSFPCANCGKAARREAGQVTRSRDLGAPLYCGRTCFGKAHRKGKTKAQVVAEKRAYDMEYREKNRAVLQAKKAAYYQRTHDPVKEAAHRKANMHRHVEYCRRPEYKRWKSTYDRLHRAKKFYGPFAEVAMLTTDLNREIKQRMTNHDIKWQNKTSNKSQFRAREAKEEERSRPRQRNRRRDSQAAHS